MLLSYNELVKVVQEGVLNAPSEQINSSSIDVRLDGIIKVADMSKTEELVDLLAKENLSWIDVDITDTGGYVLMPGQFILGSTIEEFNMTDDLVANFRLKSSAARNGVAHILAGHIDPGFCNSKLTLELHNVGHQPLILRKGLKVGQIIFHRVEPVPEDRSYKAVGQYNNSLGVVASKGIR